MEPILNYIMQTYRPLSVILYGSYACGTNDSTSDFDALVISDNCEQCHDTSFVNGVRLDVFVYPVSYFDGTFDCNDFIQIFDGKIILDSDNRGKELQAKVLSELKNRPQKSRAELKESIDWCNKMVVRAKRCDAEGLFRWHWVLTDSLEIFCDMMQEPYFGPKKALQRMEQNHPSAFECYKNALQNFNTESLKHWLELMKELFESMQ